MTETGTPTERDRDGGSNEQDGRYRPTLGALSHTHPSTDERFGQTQAYVRGPTVAADGGARDGGDGETDTDADADPLRDVDHEPDSEGEGTATQRTHERGRREGARGRSREEGV